MSENREKNVNPKLSEIKSTSSNSSFGSTNSQKYSIYNGVKTENDQITTSDEPEQENVWQFGLKNDEYDESFTKVVAGFFSSTLNVIWNIL